MSIAGCCSTASAMSENFPNTCGRIASRSNAPANIVTRGLSTETQKWFDPEMHHALDERRLGRERAVSARLDAVAVQRLYLLPEILAPRFQVDLRIGPSVLFGQSSVRLLLLAVALHGRTGVVQRREAGRTRIEPCELVDDPTLRIAGTKSSGRAPPTIQGDRSRWDRICGWTGNGRTSIVIHYLFNARQKDFPSQRLLRRRGYLVGATLHRVGELRPISRR